MECSGRSKVNRVGYGAFQVCFFLEYLVLIYRLYDEPGCFKNNDKRFRKASALDYVLYRFLCDIEGAKERGVVGTCGAYKGVQGGRCRRA